MSFLLPCTGVFVNMIRALFTHGAPLHAASLRQSQPAGSNTDPRGSVHTLVPLQFGSSRGSGPGHSLPSFHGTQGGNQRPRFMLGLDHSSLTGL